jgi:hypothetical protein
MRVDNEFDNYMVSRMLVCVRATRPRQHAQAVSWDVCTGSSYLHNVAMISNSRTSPGYLDDLKNKFLEGSGSCLVVSILSSHVR